MKQDQVRRLFDTTRWTRIGELESSTPSKRAAALVFIAERYREPLRRYLESASAIGEVESEETVSRFFCEKVFARKLVEKADVSKGRFRSYLKRSIVNFHIDLQREKGRDRVYPIGSVEGLLPDETPGDDFDVFDLKWATGVLIDAAALVHVDCTKSGKNRMWELLITSILLPVFFGETEVSNASLVERFGLEDNKQAGDLVRNARIRFARAVRQIVGRYVLTRAEIEDEIRVLMRVIACFSGPGLSMHLMRDDQFKYELAAISGLVSKSSQIDSLVGAAVDLAAQWDDLMKSPLVGTRAVSPVHHDMMRPDCLESIGEIIFAEDVSLGLLHLLHARAKLGRVDPMFAVDSEIATTLYYVVAARAYLVDGKMLSKVSPQVFRQGLDYVVARSWVDGRSKAMCRNVLELCADGGIDRSAGKSDRVAIGEYGPHWGALED